MITMPFEYLVLFFILGLLMISFHYKLAWLTAISGILMMVMAVYLYINGLDGLLNFAVGSLVVSLTGLGAYVFIRSSYELYKGM